MSAAPWSTGMRRSTSSHRTQMESLSGAVARSVSCLATPRAAGPSPFRLLRTSHQRVTGGSTGLTREVRRGHRHPLRRTRCSGPPSPAIDTPPSSARRVVGGCGSAMAAGDHSCGLTSNKGMRAIGPAWSLPGTLSRWEIVTPRLSATKRTMPLGVASPPVPRQGAPSSAHPAAAVSKRRSGRPVRRARSTDLSRSDEEAKLTRRPVGARRGPGGAPPGSSIEIEVGSPFWKGRNGLNAGAGPPCVCSSPSDAPMCGSGS